MIGELLEAMKSEDAVGLSRWVDRVKALSTEENSRGSAGLA